MLKPSTKLTISEDEEGAGVNVGVGEVVKKWEVVKQERCT